MNNLHCRKPDIVISGLLAQASTLTLCYIIRRGKSLVRSFQEDTISTKLGVLVFLAVDEGGDAAFPLTNLVFWLPQLLLSNMLTFVTSTARHATFATHATESFQPRPCDASCDLNAARRSGHCSECHFRKKMLRVNDALCHS